MVFCDSKAVTRDNVFCFLTLVDVFFGNLVDLPTFSDVFFGDLVDLPRLLHQNAGLAILSRNCMLFDPNVIRQVTSKLEGPISPPGLGPVRQDLTIQIKMTDIVILGVLLGFRTRESSSLLYDRQEESSHLSSEKMFSLSIYVVKRQKLLLDDINLLLHVRHRLLLFCIIRDCPPYHYAF